MNTKLASLPTSAAFLLTLGACDSIFQSSKFNLASEQMARVSQSDIIDRDEFKINMPKFLARQLFDLETQINSVSYDRNPSVASGFCSPSVSVNAFDAQSPFQSGVLTSDVFAEDNVIKVVLETAKIGDPGQLNMATFGEQDDLGFADFENFRRIITDAKNASPAVLNLHGVGIGSTGGVSQTGSFVSLLAPLDNNISDPKQVPLLAYLGAYYNGKFVDHFGNTFEQPAIKNGIEDGTIAHFTQVVVELLADLPEPRLGTLLESGPPIVYHPKNEESTFHKVFNDQYELKSSGKDGISAKEAKLIATGANLIADQGLTLFSGFLETLSEIHIGFIVAGNFAVGSNDTLKAVARAVIETSLRRGAERGLSCLVEKYDFDAVAEIIEKVS